MKFISILPTLQHPTLRALCRSVKNNSNSLVGGMILFDHRRGAGRGWKMVMDRNGAPVSPWPACFLCVYTQEFFGIFLRAQKNSKKLAGRSAAGPPRARITLTKSGAFSVS